MITERMKNLAGVNEESNDGFVTDIERDTLENSFFRKVIYTAPHHQLVLMSLLPGEDIGEEVHENLDQFIRIESGSGVCVLNGNEYPIRNGTAIVVPQGTKHNVINTSEHDYLKLYTVYSAQQHKDGVIHVTKQEAEREE